MTLPLLLRTVGLLFLNGIVVFLLWEVILSNIFSDEEPVILVVLLVLGADEPHLLVIRRRKYFLVLGLLSELLGEDLRLNVGVRPYIRDWKCNTLPQFLSVEVLCLYLLLCLT